MPSWASAGIFEGDKTVKAIALQSEMKKWDVNKTT